MKTDHDLVYICRSTWHFYMCFSPVIKQINAHERYWSSHMIPRSRYLLFRSICNWQVFECQLRWQVELPITLVGVLLLYAPFQTPTINRTTPLVLVLMYVSIAIYKEFAIADDQHHSQFMMTSHSLEGYVNLRPWIFLTLLRMKNLLIHQHLCAVNPRIWCQPWMTGSWSTPTLKHLICQGGTLCKLLYDFDHDILTKMTNCSSASSGSKSKGKKWASVNSTYI